MNLKICNNDNRIHYVDRLKGIAMILVVMGHIVGFRMGASDSIVFRFIQTCQIPLFMFMSGFLISTRHYYGKRLIKKLSGLIIPFFMFGGIFILFFWQINNLSDIKKSFFYFLIDPAKNGYWYLISLAVFYCFMPLFSLNKGDKKWLDIFIAFFIYVVYFVGWKKAGLIGDIFCLLNCTDFFPFFIFGFFSRKYKLIETNNSSKKHFYINSNYLFNVSSI